MNGVIAELVEVAVYLAAVQSLYVPVPRGRDPLKHYVAVDAVIKTYQRRRRAT